MKEIQMKDVPACSSTHAVTRSRRAKSSLISALGLCLRHVPQRSRSSTSTGGRGDSSAALLHGPDVLQLPHALQRVHESLRLLSACIQPLCIRRLSLRRWMNAWNNVKSSVLHYLVLNPLKQLIVLDGVYINLIELLPTLVLEPTKANSSIRMI
ncbi:uncharacterized protein LOC124164936 [Ischnura elegans]|uniref:uncharacterized protein LOC124164936 n=1 Tax=Ischnura elegans TaxID=197161 RepID=UPI001ED884A0|nr:uncharacterized protein LOC124164936 [Ischnura elegans]